MNNSLVKYIYASNIITENDSMTNILFYSHEDFDFDEKYQELSN